METAVLDGKRPCAIVMRPGLMMSECLRPFMPPELAAKPIDVAAARSEYEEYVRVFRQNGVEVIPLHDRDEHAAQLADQLPDAVFTEDWAAVLHFDNRTLVIEAEMTAETRVAEPREGLASLYRLGILNGVERVPIRNGNPDVRLETGDTLQVYRDDGTLVLVCGISSRTNELAFQRLEELNSVYRFGELYPVEVFKDRCLHLTSGAGVFGPGLVIYDSLLVNEDHIRTIRGIHAIDVDWHYRGVQNSANCVWFPMTGVVGMDRRYERNMARVEALGLRVVGIPNEQHSLGAGGLSCRRLPLFWYPRANNNK